MRWWIWGLMLLSLWGCAYSGAPVEQVNYLNQACDQGPQIDVLSQPNQAVCPSKGRAVIYCPAQGLPKAWKRRLGEIVYRAFAQASVFADLRFGGIIHPYFRTLAQKDYDFLVLIPRAELFFPTKTVAGRLVFDLEVFALKSQKSQKKIWAFTGSWNLCPQYPVDYGSVYLSRGQLPPGDWEGLEQALYLTAWKMADLIRSYGCYTEKTIPQAPWTSEKALRGR